MTRASETFLENGTPLLGGDDTGFLPDTPHRVKIDLSGPWSYTVEDGGNGQVRLPAAYDFEGNVTFSRTIDLTDDLVERYTFHLVCLGINYRSDVFVNGEFVAAHEGGYTSSVREIPSALLQPGSDNQIRIKVSNRLGSRTTIPVRLQVWGWRNYGGVVRDLYLLGTPKVFLKNIRITSVVGKGSASLTVYPVVDGEGDPENGGSQSAQYGFSFDVVHRITGTEVARSAVMPARYTEDGWESLPASVVIRDPALWSPDQPELYMVRGYLHEGDAKNRTVIDQYNLNHGFRTIDLTDSNIHLNGQQLVLKGIVWNEDHPNWGSSLPHEQMEKDVLMMKSLGVNAVRFVHHPPHPYMLNLCDRYGLLALLELPVSFVPSSVLEDEYYSQLAKTMMREMIESDRSHPSVFAWGIGEGFESSSVAARPFVDSLATLARRLDDRPVYYASVMNTADACTDLVDLAAIDMYTTDPGSFRERLVAWKEMHPGKPVIVTKFGAEVQHSNRNGYSDPRSQESQARFLLHRLEDIRNQSFDGSFVWAFNDWRSDRPALTVASGDPWMHTMGVVSHRREKRLAFDAVRSAYRGEKYVALPAGNYSSTAPIVYVVGGLVLLIGSVYLYNSDRRFREGVNRSLLNSYNFFSDVRDQRGVSVFHSTLVGAISASALAIVLSTALYHARNSWVVDAALSVLIPSDPAKEFMIGLIIDPLRLILYSAVVLWLMMFTLSLAVFVAARLFKSRLFLYHAYTVTMWSTVPLLFLIPVGMILFRLLESGEYTTPSFVLVCVLLLWTVLRILKGGAVVADVYRPKVYLLGLSSIAGIALVGYFLLDYSQSASEYLSFLYNVASTSY